MRDILMCRKMDVGDNIFFSIAFMIFFVVTFIALFRGHILLSFLGLMFVLYVTYYIVVGNLKGIKLIHKNVISIKELEGGQKHE